jgi:hypothetical protein
MPDDAYISSVGMRMRVGFILSLLLGALGVFGTSAVAEVQFSEDIRGNLDRANLQKDGTVQVFGWALDRSDPASAVTVAVFYGESPIWLSKTSGTRPDIGENFPGLHPRQVVFSGATSRVTCYPGKKLLALAIGPTGSMNVIGYAPISGC